jgi:hypothetical protein
MDRKSLVMVVGINRPFQPQQGPASGHMAPVLLIHLPLAPGEQA